MRILIDSFESHEWKQSANLFRDYSVYQTWEYQEVRAERANQKVSRIIVLNDNQIPVLMAQVRIQTVPLIGLRIGYIQDGPILLGEETDSSVITDALYSMVKAYIGDKVDILRIIPHIVNDEQGQLYSRYIEEAGLKKVIHCKPYHTLFVSLAGTKEDILLKIDRESRRNIRKAEKSEVKIIEGTSMELFSIMTEMYSAAKERKDFQGIDSSEFADMQARMEEDDKAKIMIIYYNDKPVSAHATTHFGNTAIPIITANRVEGLQCGSSYLVWWKAYMDAKVYGMTFYDLGGIDPKENPNGFLFKKRMGGEEVFFIGTFEICSGQWSKFCWNLIEKVYNIIKQNSVSFKSLKQFLLF